METKTNPNDPITLIIQTEARAFYNKGLTKREHFAAMAMQGILSSPLGISIAGKVSSVTAVAVGYADDLIMDLNKE